MRLSSSILCSIVSMVLFWYPGYVTSCAENDTFYERTISKITYSTEETTQRHTREHRPNCNFFEEIGARIVSWLTSTSSDCKTEFITVYKIVTKTVPHEETTVVTECCPGYAMNVSNICVKSECPQGKFGANCSEDCFCGDQTLHCNSTTGLCICPEGFNGTNCTEECDASHYGRNCAFECECGNNSLCNNTDGTCNCTSPGWKGYLCNQECSSTSFGLYCMENCTCNENQTCDHIDGTCTCKPGWTGDNCTDECEQGRFGTGCNQTCTCNNQTSISCDPTNGYCSCKPGYLGINCDYICDVGTYGPGCAYNCSGHCEKFKVCHFIDGSCACPGSKGDNCTEQCDPGTFGLNCSMSCDCNITNSNGTCNSSTGQCSCLDNWTGTNCSLDGSSDSVQNSSVVSGITTNDLMVIVITSGLAMVVLIVGGSIIYRKRSLSRDKDAVEDATKAIENKTYDRNKGTYKTEESTDKYSQESEMNGCLLQHDVVNVRNNEEADKRSSSETGDQDSVASDQVVYEDAEIELEKLETGTKPNTEEENDYDKTNTAHKSDSRYQDDEVLYESADDENENVDKREPNHYNTFDEVEKIGLNSIDQNKCDEGEEDYNVLEYFPHQSKKMSLKEENYSSFDAVKAVTKQSTDDTEENDYDALNQTPVRRSDAIIAHERYHHIDLKNKTIDGENVKAVSNPENRMSKSSKEEAGIKKPDGIKLSVIKHETMLSDMADEDYSFCEIDEEDIKSDTHEDIYEECTPDESVEKDNQTSDVLIVLELHDSDKRAEIVYESCGSSDEDGTVTKNVTDILYEDMSDNESDHNSSSDDNGNETQITKDAKPVRRRRSEDYEEFEM